MAVMPFLRAALARKLRRLGAAARTLRTADGEEHEFDFLAAACGQLTNPDIPAIPGAEDFEGHVFHSADWDHEHDLTGERVAVIGTGASAIQFVPEIAEAAEHLDVYQRSAPWIQEKPAGSKSSSCSAGSRR